VAPSDQLVLAQTRRWLERAVIGLNLCPFAKAEHVNDRIRYCVSTASTSEELLQVLALELQALQLADPRRCETTLLIHPQVLGDFLDYNHFLDAADALLCELELDGVLQIASFHPQYQFAGTADDDVTNCSNRSPWPTLHLLREASIDKAVKAFPDAAGIFERNIDTLRRLGPEGWRRLLAD
jgi:hypothetical protein